MYYIGLSCGQRIDDSSVAILDSREWKVTDLSEGDTFFEREVRRVGGRRRRRRMDASDGPRESSGSMGRHHHEALLVKPRTRFESMSWQ